MKFGTNSLTLLVKNKTLSHHFPMLNNFVTIDIRAMGKNNYQLKGKATKWQTT